MAIQTAGDGVSQIVAVVASRNGLTFAAIRKKVASIVPAYMVPTRVDVMDRLPKNDNGKIDRNLLKTQYC